jgi:DNA processing protein
MKIRELAKEEWPAQLLALSKPPKHLWLRGTLPTKGTKLLTVIGSGKMTHSGKDTCEKLIAGLAGYPISIVSGLALGIDTCAHRTALASGLHTLVMPASGLSDDVLYPKRNRELAKEILKKGGGILSTYEPDKASCSRYSSARNQLMNDIADAVLVINGGQEFSMILTAKFVDEDNPYLLGFSFGVTLVTEPIHILKELGITPHNSSAKGRKDRDFAQS